MIKYTGIIILVLFAMNLQAQNTVSNYNTWLSQENLSDFIIAENIEIITQDTVNYKILNLTFNTQSKDTAISYWNTLDSIYLSSGKTTFPELLFYHYLHMEKTERPDTLVIKLTDNENCLTGFIYFDEDTKEIIDTMSLCLSQTRKVRIITNQIELNGDVISLDNSTDARDAVYDKIIEITTKLYTKDKGINNNYSIRYVTFSENFYPGDDSLIIFVGGMKQEVLKNYGDPFVCWLLSYFYNQKSCHPWEYLKLSFYYDGTSKNLMIKIEGKISDGMTKHPTTWRRAKQMEPQFSDFLIPYSDIFKRTLYNEFKP